MAIVNKDLIQSYIMTTAKYDFNAVSYTHLDVYKRQTLTCTKNE